MYPLVHLQRLKFFGVIEELEQLKQVPDLDALGFTAFNAKDNLTFSSHAWTITIDPSSGIFTMLSYVHAYLSAPLPTLSLALANAYITALLLGREQECLGSPLSCAEKMTRLTPPYPYCSYTSGRPCCNRVMPIHLLSNPLKSPSKIIPQPSSGCHIV